jgi:AraC-like DNA-binding protein
MLVLSVFLFTVKSTKRTANYLLGAMLLLIAFDLSGFFIGNWFGEHLNLNILKTASSLLQMPLFFLYVLSVCYTDFKLKRKHFLHAILFFVFLLIFNITALSNTSLDLYEVVSELQWLAYMVAEFLILNRQRKVYQENYSGPNSKAYTWLFQFVVLSCIGHSFVFVRWCLSYLELEDAVLNMNIVISITTLLIITWFVFKALYYPELFTGIQTKLKPIKSVLKAADKNAITSEVLQQDIDRLFAFMSKEKPYLDFELTLQKLASQFQVPEKELSLLINHHVGKHFFDFINEYRIDEAKKILANPDEKHQTILEVLYQVGFNSKSSFYTAFKKITGKTPTVYRKEKLAI